MPIAQPPDEALDRLPLPDTGPRGLLRHFGPGLILMMTGIGTSAICSPRQRPGGRFEFALLWCIPVAYVFKYYGFEMAFRFTNATGRSMLDAYTTAPGKVAGLVRAGNDAHPVRVGAGGAARRGRRGAVLRLLRVSRAPSAQLGRPTGSCSVG